MEEKREKEKRGKEERKQPKDREAVGLPAEKALEDQELEDAAGGIYKFPHWLK